MGILFVNLSVFFNSLGLLSSSVLYKRHPDLEPTQLLFAQALIGVIACILVLNRHFKYYAWDGVPNKYIIGLIVRALITTSVLIIANSIVKYLSLIFIALSTNLVPIVTLIMAFLMGEE